MTTLKKEYQALFKQLLGPSLIPDWQHIVQAETNTKGYNIHDSARINDKVHGMRFMSMHWCVRALQPKIVKPNAAEYHCKYTMSQIVWLTTKVGIGAFVERLIEKDT